MKQAATKKAAPAIPRISLLWLLVAQALVILPHLGHLPVWIIGLWLVCASWRIQVFRMRTSYPGWLTKAFMLLAAAVGVYASQGSLIGLDAGVALLISTFVLKLVELKTRRDALVLVFLGFFTVLTSYLFEDGLPAAVYSLLPVTALLAALIGLQQSSLGEKPWPTLRLAGSLLLQALPLMLVLFVLFPRLGPLWSVPMPGGGGRGLAESMTPGDIAELSQSSELSFRASFDGPIPSRSQLYWRALTFEEFDGRRWSQLPEPPRGRPDWQAEGPALSYSIVMQPSGQPWLFALDTAATELEQTRQMGDFRLQRRRPVEQSLLYNVTSWPQARREPQASPRLAVALQLPAQGNLRARRWAAELKARHPEDSQALVDEVLGHFAREEYFYTLKPPLAGEDTVDHFLFDSRRGFCAHYAGAMTFVLRAAGIPARVVAGYQGGEVNPAGNYVLVHQFDAHAWVEYWLPGHGWISVDPTFQVAPMRIEQGLQQALPAEDRFLADAPLSPLRYRHVEWVNALRLSWDNLNYAWQRKVLGYQGDEQLKLLGGWFGRADPTRLGLILVACAGGLLGTLALLLLKPWKRELDPVLRQFRRFERLLARHGLRREAGEGPLAFAERAAGALPGQAVEIRAFAQRFAHQRYADAAPDPVALRRLLRRLRRQLPWRPWWRSADRPVGVGGGL